MTTALIAIETRKHFSRFSTARLPTVRAKYWTGLNVSGSYTAICLFEHDWEGTLWTSMNMSRGGRARGWELGWSMYGEGPRQGPCVVIPLWTDRMIDTYNWKYYLPQTSLADGNEENWNRLVSLLFTDW